MNSPGLSPRKMKSNTESDTWERIRGCGYSYSSQAHKNCSRSITTGMVANRLSRAFVEAPYLSTSAVEIYFNY